MSKIVKGGEHGRREKRDKLFHGNSTSAFFCVRKTQQMCSMEQVFWIKAVAMELRVHFNSAVITSHHAQEVQRG